jgi:flagellar motor switch protein FliM
MSSVSTDNLSREKIQRLLAAIGSGTTEGTAQIEAAEYNWHRSCYFGSDQVRKIDDFARKAATAMAKKFTDLCHSDFNVAITSITQHFAAELFKNGDEDNSNIYYLPFGPDKEPPCCLISMPSQTAIIWATQLLGGGESEENSNRDLSQLEKSLLLDIACALVEVISKSHDSLSFQPAQSIVRGELPFELHGTEEFCKISFSVNSADSKTSSQAHILMPCGKLEPVVGKSGQADGKFSSEDVSKAILAHLQEMPVSVTAQLAAAELTFEELMGLQVNDILLLDKMINEPTELIVEGRTLFRGWAAKSNGKYAVVITQPAYSKT